MKVYTCQFVPLASSYMWGIVNPFDQQHTMITLTPTMSRKYTLFTAALTLMALLSGAPGAATAAPQSFSHETVAAGFTRTTTAAFLPDGRILVAEKTGEIKVVDNGVVLPELLIDLPHVNSHGDRGLLGLAVDPDFTKNGYIYIAHTYENDPSNVTGPKTAQVIRLTVTGNTADYASRVVLLGSIVGDPSRPSCDYFGVAADCIPSDSASHSVGALRFSPDGYLFVETGDGAGFFEVEDQALRSLNLDSLAGKLLRVHTDGTAVADNPFYTGDADSNRSKVYAYGIRNSFKYNVRPLNGSVFLGDVGWDTWEEVNVARGGENFGWPCREGFVPQARYECETTNYTDPIYVYPHAVGQSSAVVGGAFAGNYYPSEYRGNYFFADVVEGTIRRMVLSESDTPLLIDESFLPGADGPVEFVTGLDGAIYYLSIFTGELRKIAYTAAEYREEAAHEGWFDYSVDGMTVSFDASLSTGPIVEYVWNFDEGGTGSGEQITHTYSEGGTKAVFLTTYDAAGRAHVASRSIVLSGGEDPDPRPTPNPTPGAATEVEGWFDYTVQGATVLFDASPSNGNITRFEWNFGDGAQGVGTSTTHTFDESGSYVVYLYSYDVNSDAQVSSRSVRVVDVSDPTADPSPSLPAPQYVSSTFLSTELKAGEPVEVRTRARNMGGDAPYLTTVEFYNERGEYAGGSSVVNEGVPTGDLHEIVFEWTPPAPGNYMMQFGYFAPDWSEGYGWEAGLPVPTVRSESGVLLEADPTHVDTTHDGGSYPVFARPITINTAVRNDGFESPFITGIEIYDEAGEYMHSSYSDEVEVSNGETIMFENEWFPSKAGTFTVHVGIFTPSWGKLYEWAPAVLTIEVFDRTPVE